MTNTTHHTSASPVVCQPGEGEHVLQMRACVTVKLPVGATRDGSVSAAEFSMPPGFGPPLHVHHREDELLQILEGSVRIVCGDSDVVVEAGGFAYLPRDVPHTFRVHGDTPARMLAVFTPGGVEAMFVDSGVATESAHLPDGDGAPPGNLEALTAHYNVEHIGPPLEDVNVGGTQDR
jgi:mannose-6-phosphate isomerase-like protein (cupin superfamily)